MNAADIATANVGCGFSVTFTADRSRGRLVCEWDPHVPRPGQLDAHAVERYRAARTKFLAGLGLSTLVVET